LFYFCDAAVSSGLVSVCGVTGILLPRIQILSPSSVLSGNLRDVIERLAGHVYTYPYHLPAVACSMTAERNAFLAFSLSANKYTYNRQLQPSTNVLRVCTHATVYRYSSTLHVDSLWIQSSEGVRQEFVMQGIDTVFVYTSFGFSIDVSSISGCLRSLYVARYQYFFCCIFWRPKVSFD
jgi:hypothetical protein